MFPIEILASYKNLSIPKSLGNHLLNFWFCCSLAKRRGYLLRLPNCNSELDLVLDLKLGPCVLKEYGVSHSEHSAFSGKTPEEVAVLSEQQRQSHLDLLKTGRWMVCSCTINGNFWHADLFGDKDEYREFFTIKENPKILPSDGVIIHHRGTDSKTHLRQIYKNGICLPTEYYSSAIEIAKKQLGNSVKFYVVTDDPKDALDIIPKFCYTLIDTTPSHAWLAIHYANHIICSNSSFCWTAALWNKGTKIMPSGGYNHNHPGTGVVPAGFYLPGAIIV